YGGPIKIQGESMNYSTPAMPKNTKEVAKITVDTSGLEVVSFEAKIGGDYPLGNEDARLKHMAVRSFGKKARYLAVLEPYENTSVIKSVTAKNADTLIVELLDGRIQEVHIENLESNSEKIKVNVKEFLNGKVIREEQSE
ncbi:hypothetical protein N9V96_04145, partial [Polaribacter sp.]|nr:hypothetical protein [Polaribacter sp.]